MTFGTGHKSGTVQTKTKVREACLSSATGGKNDPFSEHAGSMLHSTSQNNKHL